MALRTLAHRGIAHVKASFRFLAAAFVVVISMGSFGLLRGPAHAADFTLYDQFGDGAWRSAAGSTALAQSFSSHATGRYLKSVKVWIRNANESNTSSSPSTFSISVWSSTGGNPSIKLADLRTNQSIGAWSETNNDTYSATTDIDLGTTVTEYFIVLSGTGTVGWKCNSAAPLPAGSYSIRQSTNNGSTWSAISTGACSGKYFSMQVTGTDVSLSPPTTVSTTTTTTTTTTTVPPPPVVVPAPTTTAETTTTSSSTSSSVPPTTVASTSTFAPRKDASTPSESSPPSAQSTVLSQTTVSPQTTETPTTEPASSTTLAGEETEDVVTDEPAAAPLSANSFVDKDIPAPLSIIAEVGENVSQVRVEVNAVGLVPGSMVSVMVYSEPTEVLQGVVAADGSFVGSAVLPADLGPGTHSVMFEGAAVQGDVRALGVVLVDEKSNVSGILDAARVSASVQPGSPAVERAATSGNKIYDALAQPATTAALATAAAAVVSLAAGGMSGAGGSGGGQSRNEDSRAKLAGFVTKKLKATGNATAARGDLSSTWRMPFTEQTDKWSTALADTTAKFSAALPRIAVDGAWLRASLGSLGYLLWAASFVAGLFVGLGLPSIVAPAAGVATVFAAIGLFDSGLGFSAWLGTLVGAAIGGNIVDWYDARTLLGLAVLYCGLAPLAHVIRPLRRVISSPSDRIERVFDYIITPVFLAFAGGSMLKALNGLSGLDLVSGADVDRAIWAFGLLLVVRFAGEDLVGTFYPERMAAVQPAKLRSPSKTMSILAVIPRTMVLLFIAAPFFGLTWKTILSAVLLAIPAVMKPFEDDLPNVPVIHRWLPRGLFRFLCLLVLGMWMGSVLIPVDDPDAVRNSAVWLLIPSVIVGVVELFGRKGGDWPNVRIKWALGVGVWAFAASLVTGTIALF